MSFDVNPDGDVDGDFRHFSDGGTVNIFSDAQSRTLDIAPIKNYGFGGASTPLNGELLIGNGTTFSKANLTSTGGSITITNGAGTINLETAVAGYSGWIVEGGGGLTDTVNSGDQLKIDGGTGITTTLSGQGTATPTLTIDVDGTSPTGTGAANQVTYWSGASTITGDSGLQWNPTGGSERLTVTGSSASDMLRVVSTNTGTGTAPDIAFVRDRTYTAGLDLGVVLFKGPDADDNEHTYAYIQGDAKDGTVGAEKGQLDFRVGDGGNGTFGYPLRLTDTGAWFNVVNASGLDVRMDTASQDNAFLLDASENDILTQVPFRNEIEIKSTDAGAAVAPDLKLYRNSSSPAANDVLGQVLFSGEDDASQKINYASITGFAVDVATAQPDGAIVFNCLRNGTSAPYFDIGKLVSGVRAMTVNPNSLDNDFYIKTVNQTEAFKMDGSADTATFNVDVGIGTTPSSSLHVSTADNIIAKFLSTDGTAAIELADNATTNNAALTRVGQTLTLCANGGDVAFGNSISSYNGSPPTDGQLLIGDGTSGVFDKATLTSTGGTVTITNGAGTINLEAAGGGGGTPGGAGNDIQFNNGAGGFGGSSDFTYNDTTKVLALGAVLGSGVSFQQFTGLNAGGNITSNSTTFSANVNGVVALSNELGVLMETRDHQVQTGKTTTQSFGQTQKISIATGPTDCYPSEGGMIVCSDIAGNNNQVINLACMVDIGGQFSRQANPPNATGGGTPVAGVPDKAGYGTWQIGDQVTVLTNFAPGGSPNITILSYCGIDDGGGGSSDPNNTAGGGGAPSQQLSINGVTTGQTITTNYTAKTFILCEDLNAIAGVSWVAIG